VPLATTRLAGVKSVLQMRLGERDLDCRREARALAGFGDLPAGDRRRGRGVQPAVCRRSASDQRGGTRESPRWYSLGALSPWLSVDGRARSRARRHRDNAGAWFRRQSRRGSDHLDECRHACTRHDDTIGHIPFRRSSFIQVTTTRTIGLFQIGGDMLAPIGDLSQHATSAAQAL
jgi:hypothetical protein